MTEREALRTAEAWLAEHDRIEAPDLTKLPQWHGEMRGKQWARELWQCVLFAVSAIAVIYGLLSIG